MTQPAPGMHRADPPGVRRLVSIWLLSAGCFSSSMRPAVIHKVSELPADPDRAAATLDASTAQPTTEQHAPLTKKQKKIETAAATGAAVLGLLFSKTKNVGFGVATTMDENRVGGRPKPQPKPDPDKQDGDDAAKPPPEPVTAVPWLRLR